MIISVIKFLSSRLGPENSRADRKERSEYSISGLEDPDTKHSNKRLCFKEMIVQGCCDC